MTSDSDEYGYNYSEKSPESFCQSLGLRLRPAILDDAETIKGLNRIAFEPYISQIGGTPRTMLADYHQVIEQDHVWVVEEPGSLIAVLVLSLQDDHYHIDNIAVHPEWRRRGLGKALLHHAEIQSRRANHGEIWLHTNEIMVSNIRLYTAIGYEEIYRRTYHVTDSIYMRKRLR
ncbi:MAG: GNAT family N-acetyltransferase [Cyanobacteria bacterium P01_H01_bin.21]